MDRWVGPGKMRTLLVKRCVRVWQVVDSVEIFSTSVCSSIESKLAIAFGNQTISRRARLIDRSSHARDSWLCAPTSQQVCLIGATPSPGKEQLPSEGSVMIK